MITPDLARMIACGTFHLPPEKHRAGHGRILPRISGLFSLLAIALAVTCLIMGADA